MRSHRPLPVIAAVSMLIVGWLYLRQQELPQYLVPRYPRATQVEHGEFSPRNSGLGGEERTTMFLTSDRVLDVVTWYTQAFPAHGWRPDHHPCGFIEVQAPSETVRFHIRPLSRGFANYQVGIAVTPAPHDLTRVVLYEWQGCK